MALRLLIRAGILSLLLAGWLLAHPVWAENGPWFRFGVFPYVDPRTLIEHHKSLKTFLEQSLRRPLIMLTAPDFATFMNRTLSREYDLILAAPHMARFAELEGGYQRIAMSVHRIQGVIVVRSDAGIEQLADLRGRTVAMAKSQALLHLIALQTLSEQGLQPDQDVRIIEAGTLNNALQAVLHGDSDAALTGILIWDALDNAAKQRLRVLQKTPTLPGVMLMARAGLPAEEIALIRRAIDDFTHSSLSQSYFFKGGFVPVSEEDMRSLDPYSRVWRKTEELKR